MSENTEKLNSHQALSALLNKHEGKIDPNTMFTYLSFIAFTSMMNSFPAVRPQVAPIVTQVAPVTPATPVVSAPKEQVDLSNILEKIQNDPTSMSKIQNLLSGKDNSGLDTNKFSSVLSNLKSSDVSSILQNFSQGKTKTSNSLNISQLTPLLSLLGNNKQNSISGLLSGLTGGGAKGFDSGLLEGLAPLAGLLGKNSGSITQLNKFAPLLPLLDGFGLSGSKSKRRKKGRKDTQGATALPLESLLALAGNGSTNSLGSMLPLLFLFGAGKSGLLRGFQGMLKPLKKR